MLNLFIPVAHAQYSTTTAAANVDTVTNGVGQMFAQNIPVMLVIMIALIGLGWGVRKFRQHVSGQTDFGPLDRANKKFIQDMGL